MIERTRRGFLAITGISVSSTGCLSDSDEDNIKDSDGDGVIDGEDYAPNDPDVQEKSDLRQTNTPKPSDVTTSPPAQTPSPTLTPTSTPPPAVASNSIQVDSEIWGESTHITSYSITSVEAQIFDDIDINQDELRALVFAYTYPRDELVATGESDTFRRSNLPINVSTPIDSKQLPENERLQYLLFITTGDIPVNDLTEEDFEHKMDTDPFNRTGDSIKRDPHPADLDDLSRENYERESIEGMYEFTVEGRSHGRKWSVTLSLYKAAYIDRATAARGRSRPEYVKYEMSEGTAPELAQLLSDEAEANGYTGKREKVDFVIDYIQHLPYVPDDVSKGFDDYTKFIAETFGEGGGDCEDTSIMLASILQSKPFEYDCVLLQPPGHMAVGVYANDLPGSYVMYEGRRYYYVETTGIGWGVGDVPEPYDGEQVTIYQV